MNKISRYIDADDFIKNKRITHCLDCDRRKNNKGKIVYEIGEVPCRACGISDMLDNLEDHPAADVREVRHGKWIYDIESECWYCSLCEYSALNNYRGLSVESNYCPHCGAKMDGEQ